MNIKNLKRETWVGDFTLYFNKKPYSTEKNHRFVRWTWTHGSTDYYTDSDGCGIFTTDGRQWAGTCDFVLGHMSMSGARKKLNRCFN